MQLNVGKHPAQPSGKRAREPSSGYVKSDVGDETKRRPPGRGGGSIPGDNSPTMGKLFGRVTGSSRGTRGVSAEVGETQAAVNLTTTVPYGRSIPEIIQRMRDGTRARGRPLLLRGISLSFSP